MQTVVNFFQQWQAIVTVIGLVLLLSWESFRPFFSFGAKSSTRGVHVVRNLMLAALNSAVIATVFVSLWIVSAEWAADRGFGIMNWLAPVDSGRSVVHLVGAVLLLDFWTYWWHRLNHRIPFLWRFHRVHHADREMDVSTAGRFHVGEIILSSALRIPIIVLFGVFAWELVLYETVMFAIVQFHHANIAVPPAVDRALRAMIVTPYMHKVHHSRIRAETDSNYSSLLSVWDRFGRSFRIREDPHAIEFGIDSPIAEGDRLLDLLKMPLADGAEDSDD